MSKVLSYEQPQIYQSRKHFLNCCQYLICSYISAHGHPFHWLLMNNWHFCYSASQKNAVSCDWWPFIHNLEKIYGVSWDEHTDIPLNKLIHDIEQDICLLVFGDPYYLHWHAIYYNKAHSEHAFLIIKYDRSRNLVYIVDLLPEFSGWVDFVLISNSYNHSGKRSMRFTTPNYTNNNFRIEESLRIVRTNIIGYDENEHYYGLIGLNKFKLDILSLNDRELTPLIDLWWKSFKPVCDLRDGFLEFFYFLNSSVHSPIANTIDPKIINLIDQIVKHWLTFRNGLMKSKLTGTFKVQHFVSRLENIIELECNLHQYLKGVI